MALYKYLNFIGQVADAIFDQANHPASPAPRSGIYRCTGCGHEVASTETHSLPPQNHHQHSPAQGRIMWQLVVYADHRQK